MTLVQEDGDPANRHQAASGSTRIVASSARVVSSAPATRATTAPAARSAVTLAIVLNTSGRSSIACVITIAAIGMPAASNGAVAVSTPAPGVPGDAKLRMI